MATTERDSTIKTKKDGANSAEVVTRFGIQVPNLPPPEISIARPEVETIRKPEDYIWTTLKRDIGLAASGAVDYEEAVALTAVVPPRGIMADLGVSCHRLAGILKKSPSVIAQELAAREILQNLPFVENVRAEAGYVNFEIDADKLGNQVLNDIEDLKDSYGEQNVGEGGVVVIDCSSPNVAKYMSVGHLRSTVIGESLARIYRAGGYTPIRDNHLGDWGTQFGMLGHAYELWKDEIPELNEGTDPVKGLYKLYVRIHEEIESEKTALEEGQESALEKAGREWFARLEGGDPKALELLKWATTQSLTEFQRVYDLLGVKFEYQLGESFYLGMLNDVVKALEQTGVAELDERGTISVQLEDEKLRPLVIRKSDGTSVYATRDLAALVARTAWFDPVKILYVVGGDQSEYFKQVFATFRELAKEEAPEVAHVWFGMISLPEGRMSTRKGRVVFLEDVLNEALVRAKQKMQDASRDLTEEEINTISRQVGVGAVIYMDLGQGRERDIKFDFEHALSLEANSSPYIQYAHARAKSILRGAEKNGVTIDGQQEAIFDDGVERALILHLSRFSDAIMKALQENQPSVIADYTYKTADLFNQFYKEKTILKEQDSSKRNSRLRLTAAAAQVIKNGLYLLGIEAPDRM